MSDDPFNTPEGREFSRSVRDDLVPKLRQSGMVVSLLPESGQIDAKLAVELGAAILLDKPVIVVVRPGTRVPERLVRAADRIVEADLDTEDGHGRLMDALSATVRDLGAAG